eukprot:gene6709-4806_t
MGERKRAVKREMQSIRGPVTNMGLRHHQEPPTSLGCCSVIVAFTCQKETLQY